MLLTQKTNLTSANAVLAAVQAALAATGWQTLADAQDGTGKRLHMSKGGVYIHLRSALNEAGVFTDAPGNFSGIALTVGTGYTSAASWRQQPGVPVERTYGAAQAVCAAFNGAANMWLIADDLDNTLIVIETPTGVFQQLAWGTLRKSAPFNGGLFVWGTQRGAGIQSLTANKLPLAQDYALFVRADVDAFTGKWLGAGFSEQYSAGATGKNACTSAQDTTAVPTYRPIISRTVAQANGAPILLPSRVFAKRDDGKWSLLGELPLTYATHKVPLTTGAGAGSQYSLGDENYILFPGLAIKLTNEPAALATRAAGEAAPTTGARSQLERKVLITPSALDVGYIGSDTIQTLTLWNTNPADEAVSAGVSVGDYYGIQLQGSPLFTLAPGSTTQRTLTLKATGKPIVREQVVFAFAGLRNSAVSVSGNRLVLFTLSPDWGAPVRETISYPASVIESYGGNEQRASLVSKPGRTLAYTALALTATELSRAEAALYTGQALAIGAPCWTQASRTLTDTAAGATRVEADTTLGDYTAGGFAVLTLGELAEVVEVQAVDASGLTLSRATTQAFTKGAQLAPLMVARIEAELASTHDTAAVAAYDISLVEEV